LRARNALLKQPRPDDAALESFTRELVDAGERLIRFRHELMPKLVPVVSEAYGRIAAGADDFQIAYQPAVQKDFTVELAQSRPRERVWRSTVIGPHRDELALTLSGRPADELGSEGQKRSIAISLKMAQAEYLTQIHGSPPVLLIDDIMGELDAQRRGAFVPLLERVDQAGSQVFMTATAVNWDLGRQAQTWDVRGGTLRRN
jgi:DNA replication and repair protein RecF